MRPRDVGAPGAVASGDRAREQTNTDHGIVPTADAERKDPFESLRAMAALHGHRVHRLDGGGGFIVVGPMGWCSRELRDVHALAQALRGMGVRV